MIPQAFDSLSSAAKNATEAIANVIPWSLGGGDPPPGIGCQIVYQCIYLNNYIRLYHSRLIAEVLCFLRQRLVVLKLQV